MPAADISALSCEKRQETVRSASDRLASERSTPARTAFHWKNRPSAANTRVVASCTVIPAPRVIPNPIAPKATGIAHARGAIMPRPAAMSRGSSVNVHVMVASDGGTGLPGDRVPFLGGSYGLSSSALIRRPG